MLWLGWSGNIRSRKVNHITLCQVLHPLKILKYAKQLYFFSLHSVCDFHIFLCDLLNLDMLKYILNAQF
jgi:hypothetical protein